MFNLRKILGMEQQKPMRKQLQKLEPKKYITADNMRTNQMVAQGQLPANQAEVYPQRLQVRQNFSRQTNQVNPVDMDSVPGNLQMGSHPAYYQGSNPFQNQPRKNLYQNISPMPVDEMWYGRQIQNAGDNYNPFY